MTCSAGSRAHAPACLLPLQLFAGKFASCVSEPTLTTRVTCESTGERWANPRTGNFDNILSASLLLFEMSSLEGTH